MNDYPFDKLWVGFVFAASASEYRKVWKAARVRSKKTGERFDVTHDTDWDGRPTILCRRVA